MASELILPTTTTHIPPGQDIITIGAGCFWCIEAVFQRLKGVKRVVSGYSGGIVTTPTYQEICTGTTGHAEVIQVYFNASEISFAELFEIFWASHDPTTQNSQGADLGPQYRSVIFYHELKQKDVAEKMRKQLNDSKVFLDPVRTEISAFSNFYQAENHHQDYYSQNAGQPYCQFVIRPKVEKLKRFFSDRLK